MSATAIPLRFRAQRSGPEQSLVDWFLAEDRVSVRPSLRVTVFREPAIESGTPDVVLVMWKPMVARTWNTARAELTKSDLRLLQLLVHQGPCTIAEIENVTRFRFEDGLARLERAAMIRKSGRRWRPRALGDIFAATEIIAIEAKMSDWRRGLAQASGNRWFASTSYLLMPRVPRSDEFWSAAGAAGVGVWTREERFQNTATCGALPCSYASWLFHESAWRQSLA